MCLNRNIEYLSSSDSINNLNNNITLEWPLGQVNRLIIACNFCFYPITLEQFILRDIRNESNISFGIIIPIRKLFSKIGIYNEHFVEQWKTVIFCPNCGIILSFLNPQLNHLSETDFGKVSSHIEYDEQIAILHTYSLYRGSSIEAFSRFQQMNNIYENLNI